MHAESVRWSMNATAWFDKQSKQLFYVSKSKVNMIVCLDIKGSAEWCSCSAYWFGPLGLVSTKKLHILKQSCSI